ncbi:MAG TPA: carboxypeptidase-like regulatory domain-containing protein [Methylomirabilota bacterium]|jgi:hypothetical protein
MNLGPMWNRAWVALVCVAACLGCATSIRGRVVDAATGQPLAGVAVLGVWQRIAGFPGLHHHELVGVAEAQTDENGRFALKRPRGLADEESVTAYKFGYVAWNNIYVFPSFARRPNERIPSTVPLEHFPADQSHSKHASFISLATTGYESKTETRYFWNAIRQERQR